MPTEAERIDALRHVVRHGHGKQRKNAYLRLPDSAIRSHRYGGFWFVDLYARTIEAQRKGQP